LVLEEQPQVLVRYPETRVLILYFQLSHPLVVAVETDRICLWAVLVALAVVAQAIRVRQELQVGSLELRIRGITAVMLEQAMKVAVVVAVLVLLVEIIMDLREAMAV
jgi:hypothetical protein